MYEYIFLCMNLISFLKFDIKNVNLEIVITFNPLKLLVLYFTFFRELDNCQRLFLDI